jgi:putative solute:sodium symporter small subunit
VQQRISRGVLEERNMSLPDKAEAYWKANLSLVGKLMAVWFIVSYGFGILLADFLNQFSIGGIKLGFFFAQQGAVYVFVVLIFIYVKKMGDIDRQFDVDEE